MSRKQKAKRHKSYRRRPVRRPMILDSHTVLEPIERILDDLERLGQYTVWHAEDGTPGYAVFTAWDGNLYGSAGAIEGVLWHFDMMQARHRMNFPLVGMRAFHDAILALQPLSDEQIDLARADLDVMRRALSFQNRADAMDMVQQAQIREQLEKLNQKEKA